MVMPYTAIQFTVLQKLKTYAAGSSKAGIFQYEVDYDSEEYIIFWHNVSTSYLSYLNIQSLSALQIIEYGLMLSFCSPLSFSSGRGPTFSYLFSSLTFMSLTVDFF